MTPPIGRLLLIGRGVMGAALGESFAERSVACHHVGYREWMTAPDHGGQPFDVVIDTTRDVASSEAVANSLRGRLAPGALYFSLSTLTTDHVQAWSEDLQARGVVPVVCPVTGSHWRARAARLSAFLWAPADEQDRAIDVARQLFAGEIYPFSSPQAAMRFKLAFNECNAGVLSAAATFHARLRQAGMLAEGLAIVRREVSWIQPVMNFAAERLEDPVSPVTISVENMLKDLRYARSSFGASATADAVEERFAAACARAPTGDFMAIFDNHP